MTPEGACVQEKYAPRNRCFGCGPMNEKGLRIRSFPGAGGGLVARFKPESHHEAWEGMLNGGIVGALLDCHSNWTAAIHLMERAGADTPPCTVTAEFAVKLKRPTPTDRELRLAARVVESSESKAIVEAELRADGELCATCRGTFVAVKPGHPAYHRW
jgi:acyl-coenzyme A thioesterase PaaI-like protein